MSTRIPPRSEVKAQERESWKETQAIKDNPELMREIRAGLRAMQEGNRGKSYSLDELFEFPPA